jgi:peptidoglycan/LPS O-acetylase OafA/YrhL
VRHWVSYTWGYFFGAVASTLGGRFAALDGLRAIAFLMVMVAHGTRMDAATPVDSWFHALGSAGWCGVDLFFALSGFLITGILLRSKASHHYYRDYYLRRILRIFPLYFGFLLIYCELLPAIGIMPVPTDYEKWSWAYWCCVANLAIAANGGWATSTLAVFWTLAVEEQFYLVWPAIVKRMGVVSLAGLCCAVALAALIWRWHLSLQLSEPVVPIYVSTLTRVDSLAFGALAAVVFAWAQRSNSGPWLRRVAGWITTVGASLLIIAGHMRGKFHFSDPFVHTIGFTLLAVTFSALVLHVALKQEGQWLPRLLTQRWLVSVGRYSYAMYVTHMVVLVHWLLPQNPPKQWPTWLGSQIPAQLAMYVICLIAVYSIARLSWLLIESHFMRIRKH